MKPCAIEWCVALATEGKFCVVHQAHRDLRTEEIDTEDRDEQAYQEGYDDGYDAAEEAGGGEYD